MNVAATRGRCHSSLTLANEHELVSIRIEAHGQMRCLAILFLRFARQPAAIRHHFGSSSHYIRDLETHPGPSLFSLAAAVDADDRTGDFQFRNMAIRSDHFRAENFSIEIRRPRQIRCPDDILDALDGHAIRRRKFRLP